MTRRAGRGCRRPPAPGEDQVLRPVPGPSRGRGLVDRDERLSGPLRAEHGEDAEAHAETLLCVFNLSSQPVTATLEMTGMDRRTVRDLFGGHEFPAVDEAGSIAPPGNPIWPA